MVFERAIVGRIVRTPVLTARRDLRAKFSWLGRSFAGKKYTGSYFSSGMKRPREVGGNPLPRLDRFNVNHELPQAVPSKPTLQIVAAQTRSGSPAGASPYSIQYFVFRKRRPTDWWTSFRTGARSCLGSAGILELERGKMPAARKEELRCGPFDPKRPYGKCSRDASRRRYF